MRSLLAFIAVALCVRVPAAAANTEQPTIINWQLSAADIRATCVPAIQRARLATNRLASRGGARTFGNTVLVLENLNADLNDTLVAQQFLSQVSPDKMIRKASIDCANAVAAFNADQSADPKLYAAVMAADKSATARTPYDRKLTQLYLTGMRRSGAGLPARQRAEFVRLSKQITDLQFKFTQNIANDTTVLKISKFEAAGLKPDFLATLKPGSDGGYIVPVTDSIMPDFMANASNEDARKKFYFLFYNRQVPLNVTIEKQTIADRDRLARLLGYPSWAAYQMAPRSVKTPARVRNFLTGLDKHLLPDAREQIAQLAAIKASQTGQPAAVINAWDVPYYLDQLQKSKYALDANEVRRYFPEQHTVDAILAIYQRVLGVTFSVVTPANNWYPDVTEYSVRDAASGKFLGTFMLDLYPRAGKPGGAFNAPILPVRVVNGRKRPPVSTIIVSDWPAPAPGKPALLTHSDVVTFFHEFGHNMAALLAQVPYESLTSFQIDFVEAPSQMLENFVWSPAVLKEISSNVDDGKPLPDELIAKMLAARCATDRLCNAYAAVRQVFYALVDLDYHTSGPNPDTNAIWHELAAKDTPVPVPAGVTPQTSLLHIMGGYDGGLYSYMWSLVYAQDLFTAFERGGLENPQVGLRYRRTILAPAQTFDPDVEVKHFLGRPMSPAAFYAAFDHRKP